MEYDSTKDTLKHIQRVGELLHKICHTLLDRIDNHDNTKLVSPEKEKFDEYTPKLKGSTYGSEEYKTFLKELDQILLHHYSYNSHHPEHYDKGIDDMTLVDVIEMLCDWKAASERHLNGNILKSIEINTKRFNMSEQLKIILENTAKKYF
uniref:Uncharacterized protein n=1 Tax=viral metagenome TaxID=1070528 RepID=A0A6M3IIT3_9ZZZZ